MKTDFFGQFMSKFDNTLSEDSQTTSTLHFKCLNSLLNWMNCFCLAFVLCIQRNPTKLNTSSP